MSESTEKLAIRQVQSEQEMPDVNLLATEIWPGVYGTMLPPGQVEYMFGRMYDLETLCREHREGIAYFIAELGGHPVGYFSVEKDPDGKTGKLHKLYLKAEYRRRGFGRSMIEYAADWARRQGLALLKLNVNRDNAKAIEFYESCGWKLLYPEKNDIGGGFFMDDYVLGINR